MTELMDWTVLLVLPALKVPKELLEMMVPPEQMAQLEQPVHKAHRE